MLTLKFHAKMYVSSKFHTHMQKLERAGNAEEVEIAKATRSVRDVTVILVAA